MSETTTSESSTIETRAQELEGKLAAAEKSLSETREALNASERKREVECELAFQGAIDIQAASLLMEATATTKPDIRAAIAELKRGKPYLFRTLPRASAMSGVVEEAPSLDKAAGEARASGDRRALLRYLRMRRGA